MQAPSDPAIYSPEAGAFVNSQIARLAEILRDYDNYLELRWIPPNLRGSEDTRPYAIVHCLPGREPYTVLYFTESDDPVEIFARILGGDGARGNVLKHLEKLEASRQIFQTKKHIDELNEAADQMHFLMTNRSKNWVNWKDVRTGEIVKLDSNRRRVERS